MRTAQDGLEWYKQVLEENSSFLVDKLDLNAMVFASMLSKKILTSQEVEDLEDERIKSTRTWNLVKLMQKKSSRSFLGFLEVLRERGQKHIAAKLAADIKHKSKYNDSERCAQENINKYIHANLGQSTHISITDQKKLKSELVLQTDYQYLTSVNRQLLQEIEELQDDLKDEKRDHQMTRDQLNDMIKHYKAQLAETEQVRKQMENLECEFKKSLQKIKQLQQEKTALREELDSVRENMVQALPPQHEQSDDAVQEMKKCHQEELATMSADVTRLQGVINQQEKELKAMNKKVHAIMNDIPQVQSDSCEDDTAPHMSSLQCLDHILAHFNASSASQHKSNKHRESKEKRQQLLKQLEGMTHTMQEQQEEWAKERQRAKEKEKAMQRNINNYREDIRTLKKKVEELNTPTPETRGRSDSLASLTALPQVDLLQRSFMVAQQPHPNKITKRQMSSDTISSLPTFPRPVQAPTTSHSLPFVSTSRREQPLQCVQCCRRINRTELMTATCQYHSAPFNPVQQRWPCCYHPSRHPGCRAGRHVLKK